MRLTVSSRKACLTQCRVGGDALDHLLSGLTARPLPLRVLDLSGCGLREEGSRSLATALRSASVPKRIVVSRNDIPWAGARCLLEALAERTTTACKILDLGGNPLGPESGQGVPALAVHAGVESLCLFECGVGDEGGRGLASGLAACTTLQHLDVGANGMSVETLRSLVEASCGCPSLRTLEVAANPGVQEGAFEVRCVSLSVCVTPRRPRICVRYSFSSHHAMPC